MLYKTALILGQVEGDIRFFTRQVTSDGKPFKDESYSKNWDDYYGSLCSLEFNDKTYIAGQARDSRRFYIREVTSDGKLVEDESYSKAWNIYYPSLCSLKVNGKTYIAGQSDGSISFSKRFFIQEVTSDGKLVEDESYSKDWNNYYGSLFSLEFNDKTYIAGQSDGSLWGNKRFFIQEVTSDGKLVKGESYSKDWNNYYGSLCSLKVNGKTYIAGQSDGSLWGNKRFFIQEVTSDGKLAEDESYSKDWDCYYNPLIAISDFN